jgi:hypothetical protein
MQTKFEARNSSRNRLGHKKSLGLRQGSSRLREMRKQFDAEIGGRNVEQFASKKEKAKSH